MTHATPTPAQPKDTTTPPRKEQRWRWLLAFDALLLLGFMGAIFWASANPSAIPIHLGLWHFDKVVHFGAFGCLSVLICRFSYRLTGSFFWAVWLGTVLGGLYGLSDELHQSYVPGRSADIYDLFADICGAFAGAMFWMALVKRYDKLR